MATTTQKITAEELLAMPHDQPCELIAGEIVMMTPSGSEHSEIGMTIGTLLRAYVTRSKLGKVYGADGGFIIARDPDTVRAPDVAFVRADRVKVSPKGFFSGSPDLAVEVVSPDDRGSEVNEKAKAWLDCGTAIVWVVWPETRSITVHRVGRPPRIINERDKVTGEDVLPGFECIVAEFFRG